jgi:hypothetical protein
VKAHDVECEPPIENCQLAQSLGTRSVLESTEVQKKDARRLMQLDRAQETMMSVMPTQMKWLEC